MQEQDVLELHAGFFQLAQEQEWMKWALEIVPYLVEIETIKRNSDRLRWEKPLLEWANLRPSQVLLTEDIVTIGSAEDLHGTGLDIEKFKEQLLRLSPWRKGPYSIFGVHIDTEWRSDWKWTRVVPHISSLRGRTVLDVGCGSGYHSWRMVGAGASVVIAIDPSQLFWTQWRTLHQWANQCAMGKGQYSSFQFLPLKMEQWPTQAQVFDTVFSMGVLYHRKSPFEHLEELRNCLRKGGELVLETLVVEGDEQTVFVPPDRYALMNNVWCLPSVKALCVWLEKTGFRNPRCVDISVTSLEEQRSTEWMRFQSLANFLAPDGRTIEGHAPPTRAVIIAQRI